MIDITDAEYDKIVDVVERIRVKHMDGSERTGEKLHRLHNELEGRLNDIGFKVHVDVTPLYDGNPPTVAIVGRVEPREFDHERKQWEVRKRQGKDVDQIEGMI